MIRSFIGLPVPSGAARAIVTLQNGLPFARSIEAESLHLTLAFLGDQPQSALRALCVELGDLRAEPLDVRLKGVSLLGGRKPGSIALVAKGGEALVRLQARIARVVRESGIGLERRRFKPHVTIFRLSRQFEITEAHRIQHWIERNADFEPIDFSVHGFALFRSSLTKYGASYDVLAEFGPDGSKI